MHRKQVLRVVAGLAVMVLVASACSKKSSTTGKPTVTLYFQGALTGPYNLLVVPGYEGAQLRVNELNADKSFPATIILKGADTGDQTNPTPAIQQVAADTSTVGVLGPAFSGETEAGGNTYSRAGIPFVTGSATRVSLPDHHWATWYRTVGNDNLQGTDDGLFLAKKVGCKKLFVSNDKSAYGEPLSVTVGQTAAKNGATVVKTEGVEPTANYAPLISDIKSSGADCVFYGGYDADFAKLVPQGVNAGLSVKWMSGDGSASSTFVSGTAKSGNGVYLSTFSNLLSPFIAKFDHSSFGGSAAASVPVYSAEYYDVMGLFANGIKQAFDAGQTSVSGIRSAIVKYLNGLNSSSNCFQGVTKCVWFASNHDLGVATSAFYIYQDQNGKIVQLGSAAKLLGLT